MTAAWLGLATAPASALWLALLLARRGLQGRLFLDALALGVTLGAAVAFAEAPFDLRRNPLHFAPETMAFLFAGLPEEGVKMLGAAAFLRTHWLCRSRRDVTLATGALSLGFAALENVFYLANGGAGSAALAVDRALTAMPFHVFEGLAGGFVVASVSPNALGLGIGLIAWLGIAAVHGLYDFAVFAGADGAAPRLVAWLGLESPTALRALLALAEAVAALAAAAALSRLGAPPPASSRLARFARSQIAGWLFGAPLVAGAALALAGAGALAFALETPDPLFATAVLAVSPLGLGLMLSGERRRWPPAARRAAVAVGGVAAAAALVYGGAQWRQLTAMRFEARAARLAAAGDDRAAVEALGRALEAAPGRLEILSQRAAAEVRLKRYDAALADIDAAVRLASDNVVLRKQRADIDRQRNDPAATIADLDAALALTPADPELLAMRAQARIDAGDSKAAYADLDAASRLAPDHASVRRVFAAWDVDAGDFDAALKDLNARLHADPNDAAATFQRGRVWLYKGEAARALADFLRADRDPRFLYPALWAYLARAALKQDGGAELLARVSKAPPGWPAPVARLWLGLIDHAAARAAASDAGEVCEADFYFAALRFARYGRNEAEPGLREAMRACPTGFIEYEAAKAWLRRAGRP
jgi:lipoprotein NlpI